MPRVEDIVARRCVEGANLTAIPSRVNAMCRVMCCDVGALRARHRCASPSPAASGPLAWTILAYNQPLRRTDGEVVVVDRASELARVIAQVRL